MNDINEAFDVRVSDGSRFTVYLMLRWRRYEYLDGSEGGAYLPAGLRTAQGWRVGADEEADEYLIATPAGVVAAVAVDAAFSAASLSDRLSRLTGAGTQSLESTA